MIEHNGTVVKGFETDFLKRAVTEYSKANIKLTQSLGTGLSDSAVKALVDRLFDSHALLVEAVHEYGQDKYDEGYADGNPE